MIFYFSNVHNDRDYSHDGGGGGGVHDNFYDDGDDDAFSDAFSFHCHHHYQTSRQSCYPPRKNFLQTSFSCDIFSILR